MYTERHAAFHFTAVLLCFWGVLTRLDKTMSPTTRRSIYTSSSRFGAPHSGAASTARACSSVAVMCKAACLSVYTSSLVNTLPITKKNKHTAHSSHRGTKKSICTAFALANLLQKANSGSSWRLSSEQSVCTYKLTSYMSLCLWAILQENYREEYGLQTPTEP